MKRICTIILFNLSLFLFITTTSNAAPPVSMGIVTGSTKGTYYQFGLNIAELVKTKNIQLSVSPSKGSVENVYAVFKRPRTQLGIVQADVLAFVSRIETDPVLQQIARKIKLVFPLYNEEIHLIGNNTLTEFADLTGKKVAIGTEGSGTYLTARLLFEISGVTPGKIVTIGTNEALTQLKAGQIDAMFYVAGYPVKLFSDEISESDNLILVPIRNEAIGEFYPETDIPAGTYGWQQQTVPTKAVKAVLVSYNFRNKNCVNVGRVGRYIYDNLAWLQKNGHPKWNGVDLDFPLKGWEQYDCVQKRLAARPAATKQTETVNPVLEAIKDVLQN
ncbi:TAXI family TRAP transporter solute-binding subunit [Desulfogranum marinum]|uniref:TAXI family TRAP transporter solute-binding subunit n=1 Tax=Desulfogranum marinum TaxID=453220 RepID=UPI0019644CE1|nr:TAXI family TRAP transporter solute-binding subunit [Desulfogranum marinum]MBM9515120.1 TAXI family TRAP transporter solute-binding subunit [Desulfogranum marinum]